MSAKVRLRSVTEVSNKRIADSNKFRKEPIAERHLHVIVSCNKGSEGCGLSKTVYDVPGIDKKISLTKKKCAECGVCVSGELTFDTSAAKNPEPEKKKLKPTIKLGAKKK